MKWIEAAVLVLRHEQGGEDCIVLTKRTDIVLHHKGQISFPGGARDAGDKTLWETALREAHEEVGIEPEGVIFVEELGRHFTPTGFRVTPFVAKIETPPLWRPNPVEIAEIFSVPSSHFLNKANVRLVKKMWEGREFLDPHITYQGHEIWGMTGRILCELFGILPER
jgi:8-oxo-dGTP pyrophosphatase MutT (NUDIX family)